MEAKCLGHLLQITGGFIDPNIKCIDTDVGIVFNLCQYFEIDAFNYHDIYAY